MTEQLSLGRRPAWHLVLEEVNTQATSLGHLAKIMGTKAGSGAASSVFKHIQVHYIYYSLSFYCY